MPEDRWLIAGLGNPGPSYAGNRHNAGYLTADVLAARAGARFRAGKFRALAAEGRLAGFGVIIIKPATFMNESGAAVGGVSGYYRLPASAAHAGRGPLAELGARLGDDADLGHGRTPL